MGSDILFRPARRLGDERDIPFRIHGVGFGVAGLLEAGEFPEVRKVPALLGFHRLHRAIATFKEQALAVCLLNERKPAPIPGEPGEALDELVFSQRHEGSQAADLVVIHADVARPPAAGSATLAFVEDRHEPQGKEDWTIVNIRALMRRRMNRC